MIDEQKMRELAEAATPGPWSYEDDSSFDDGHNVMSGGYYIAECFDAAGDQHEYKTADKNAAWIAAANPSAILALLDELATLRSERTAWRVTAENAEKDAARLDWMIFHSASLNHGNDGEYCRVVWRDHEFGEQATRLFGDSREAIDAAIEATKETP